jgi:hypothetical protein
MIRLLAFMGILFATAGSMSASWWDGVADCLQSIPRDIKRRQCWPQPFDAPDRAAVRAPFATMVANGWRKQNLLGDYYFEPNTGKLNEAGSLKVRWIITEGPEQHRIIYVRVADSEEATAARIAVVQEQVARIAAKGSLVPVLPTTISDEGWPADEVETIARTYRKSTPVPRLPAAASTSSGSGNGASGAANN